MKKDGNYKEIWFAREKYVLVDAIKDSIARGNKNCEYNPEIKSSLKFEFPTDEKNQILFRVNLKGLIEFEDKLIFTTRSAVQTNLLASDIYRILSKYNVKIYTNKN